MIGQTISFGQQTGGSARHRENKLERSYILAKVVRLYHMEILNLYLKLLVWFFGIEYTQTTKG